MIIVKGTRTGGGPKAAAAEIYRTHDEKPGGRIVALVSAGLAGALAFLAAGTTGAEARPEPAPAPKPAGNEPDAPTAEPAATAGAAAALEEPPEQEPDAPYAPRLPEMTAFADAPMVPDMPGRLGRSGAAMRQPSDDAAPLPAP
ncbi:hypothetical protein K9U40_07685, partial [Xanthobacter autotrophicus]